MMFDHPNGGFIDRIQPSDYGLHVLSSSFMNGYEIGTPDQGDDGLLVVTADQPTPFTVTGSFNGGFTTATFGGAIGDSMLVYAGGGKLFVVSTQNVTLS